MKLFILLLLLFFITTTTASGDVDFSISFDVLLKHYKRHNSLEINDINDFTTNLLRKFNCNSFYRATDCTRCLSSPYLQMNGLIGTTVERNEFKNVSIVILCYLADLPQFCHASSQPNLKNCMNFLTSGSSQVDKTRLKDLLNQMKAYYKPDVEKDNGLCVDSGILFDKYTNQLDLLSQIASDIVTSLYQDAQIGCDYPYSTWFLDQLYSSYASENQVLNHNGLNKIMKDMGLEMKNKVVAHRSSVYDKCYTSQGLLATYKISNESISKADLQTLSSALTYMSVTGVCRGSAMTKTKQQQKQESVIESARSTNTEKYAYGTIAICIVSILALLGIFLLPCFNKRIYEDILTALTSLAVGTLFSDAMLHIIPQILGLEDHADDESDEIQVPLYIIRICVLIAAMYVFWLLEVIFYKLTGRHAHSHSHSPPAENDRLKVESRIDALPNYGSTGSSASSTTHYYPYPPSPVSFNPEVEIRDSTTTLTKRCFDFRNVKATAWMLIFSDAIHNFADGLAVGSSFATSVKLGISTTIAIVCHEIPHELGNYAVLVKCGLSHTQALILNLLSACSCFIGFYVGVSVSSNETASLWIFSITAGMFFYVALVDLLPTLLLDGKWSWKLFTVVNICLWLGFIIMFLLVIFEDKISI